MAYDEVQEARELFALLKHLEVTAPEIAALRAAGVGQHRIDALYPRTFKDLMPGLITQLGDYDLAGFDDRDDWRRHLDSLNALKRDIDPLVRGEAEESWQEFMSGSGFDLLREHIVQRIQSTAREVHAYAMVSCLWHAHWFMLHAAESGAAERVAEYFVEVMGWLLPELRERALRQLEVGL